MDFDIVTPDAITDGQATDAYFERTETTLRHADRNPQAVAEITADQFPSGEFELLAGIKDAAALLSDLAIDVDAIPAGRLFDGGPVMRLRGPYLEFARYETALLGFLSHASGVATAALAARRAAPDSVVLSFGARHVHPSIAAMVERSALLAGLDGFSHVAAGDVLNRSAGGTMPHALMLCFGRGEQEAAWEAFDTAVPESVPRVALCDTYSDEVDETVRAALALGDRLDSVRIDTTRSRRGDLSHIVREIRWTLDSHDRDDIDIFVSGGLTPDDLKSLAHIVDGFGVGGAIANADPVDFALDIVSVDGKAVAKRGKLPGKKAAYRAQDGSHLVQLADESPPENAEPLLSPLIRDGDIVSSFDLGLEAAAQRTVADVSQCHL
ncbi:MAG: nicotinic acid phosphoribosyltransferase [Haloquadratum sp. J07HQX50]|jgi:Nicotinic acid phosphoribosyltransferase|nr:MAG: nicotinic acid phosphoribosyltransferase [Haloquadratum sp. J07HQX50]